MSTTLQRTASQIIKKALSLLQVTDAETPLEGYQTSNAIDTLNDMVKHWQSVCGFNLWLETEATLPLVQGQTKYSLGASGSYCADEDDFLSYLNRLSCFASPLNVL